MIIHVKPGKDKRPVYIYEEPQRTIPPAVPKDKKELPGGGRRLPGVITVGDVVLAIWKYIKAIPQVLVFFGIVYLFMQVLLQIHSYLMP